MRKYNVIIVFDQNQKNIIMCYRMKEPYKGLYNLIGGKIEENETGLESAYRELYEETGILKNNINLTYLMQLVYPLANEEVQVYVGKLKKDVKLIEEAHPLSWVDVKKNNFFDQTVFAGEGNIGHMIEHVWLNKDQILK